MNCCTTTKNLGCIQSCDNVQILETADATGTWTIELQPDRLQIATGTQTNGSALVFTNVFNEEGISIFRLLRPDGTVFTASGGEDCFQIENAMNVDPSVSTASCADATVYETDGTTVVATVPSGGTHTLDGSDVTDPADSSTTTLEDGESYTCIKKLIVKVYFADGTDTITANGEPGTITSEATDGASTFTYNGSAFAAWDKAWGGDVTIVRSSSSGAEILTLEGTYT